jgi:hypothetical protein
VACSLACSGGSAPRHPPVELEILPDKVVQEQVRPLLRPGEVFARQVVRGQLGPHSGAVLAVVQSPEGYRGMVLSGETPGKIWELPALGEPVYRMGAALLVDVERDGVSELVLMIEQSKPKPRDPRRPPLPGEALPGDFRNLVFRWKEGAFVRDPTLEDKLKGLDAPLAVAQALGG